MCSDHARDGWLPIAIAPDHCDLELGHVTVAGIEALRFPCRRRSGLWYNVWTDEAVLIHPTHWRSWRG
ncbi:MAG TPA: hypothetical protein VFL62_11905 [Bradyrhizobium sp.]|uniref:hypothetical protein n=1 Tax=Bradyrhizobium sp. TaxID=376 RepID=UPI002D7F5046|nr:hypothetical protein [Bradyrhizobium sp.]HET7886921.1 hypothetical protein [Bradyrhizobium sp.]